MLRFRALRPPSTSRSIALALVLPGIAISLGLILDRRSLVGATSLCLLAVVAAAALGGRRSGLVASAVAFLGLNFFFTEPHHTFAVHRLADLVALFVFLAVSLFIGAVLTRLIEERERAERRVAEARFLDRITSRLISGEPMEKVLGMFARDLVEMFELARCEIWLSDAVEPIMARSDGEERHLIEIPLGASGLHGTMVTARATPFGSVERSFLQALAGQAALALARAALDDEVTRARVESEASRLRAALFSSVTHDLRTPLASIKASAGGLLGEAVMTATERDEMLRTILEEADRLNRLVANLLDLARMRAGALTPARGPAWVQDIVNAVLARMRRKLDGFNVRVQMRADLPAVSADATQLDQVLTNVLENAARFSPTGGEIMISAAPWRTSVQVRISDQGPGIPTDEREKAFEEFYRKDAGRGRGGTGLGLAIARAIVQAHGGRIWAEGAPSGGAAIVFELPVSEERLPVEAPV